MPGYYGNGFSLNRTFDLDGRLTGQSVTADGVDGILSIQDLNWSYNPVSSISNIDDLLDTFFSQSFDYDELDRLSLAQTDSSLYGMLGFSYDANGNRTQQDDNSLITDYLINSSNNQTESIRGTWNQFFQYDDRGNIIRHGKNGDSFDYYYNQQNRLSQISKNSLPIVSYQYNGLGQRTHKASSNGNEQYYLYNHNQQLSSELGSSGNITHDYLYFDSAPLVMFTYESAVSTTPVNNNGIDFNTYSIDPFGKNQDKTGSHQGEIHGIGFDGNTGVTYSQLFKIYGTEKRGINNYNNYAGGVQHYQIPKGQFYTGQFNHLFFSNDHDKKNPTAQGCFRNVQVYEVVDSEIYFYHNDHLGTPQVLTDETQTVVWEGHYSPFGEVQISTEIVENNLRFAGQYFDQESGLHYNYFRYYAPTLGRYITSDPIGLNGGLNTYGYVGW